MTDIKPGDFFLLPYAGKDIELLVEAVMPTGYGGGQWLAKGHAGRETIVLLSSCKKITKREAKRIQQQARPND